MQHYGIINDATTLRIRYSSGNNGASRERNNVNNNNNVNNSNNAIDSDYIIKKYPELLVSLSGGGENNIKNNLNNNNNNNNNNNTMLKCDRRTERNKKFKRNRRRKLQPQIKLKKQFESAFFHAMDTSYKNDKNNNALVLFTCPICRNILSGPVTVECGHSFCLNCLNFVDCSKCVVCSMDLCLDKGVDVLVQNLVEKWRERNKIGNSIPNTADILGVEPRYHLRSRFAGLQINEEAQRKAINLKSLQSITKYNNTKLNKTITTIFREVEDIKEKAIKCHWNSSITLSDLECILCSRSLLDPITTGCGHTFCRGCLTRVLDHGLSCPLCMTSLSVKDYSRGTNMVLDQAIRYLFHTEHNERIFANIQEIQLKSSDIPVFICTNAFPGVACPLFVYEPRYRLLVRRCLLSQKRRFAMAAKGEQEGGKFVTYGTVLQVKDAVLLEDGSYILTTVGITRFKVVNQGEQDGYDTATIQTVKDTAVPTDKLQELVSLHQNVYSKASKWIQSLNSRVLDEVERLIGHMPKVERNWLTLPDGPSWMWWLMPILPISSQLQVGFLSSVNLEKRLRAIDKMLERMEIRMKALELSGCSETEDSSEFCSESDTPFDIPFNTN